MLTVYLSVFVTVHYTDASRLQSQLSEKEVMVSKVQPELLRQCSVNRLLGADNLAMQNPAVNGAEVMMHIVFLT